MKGELIDYIALKDILNYQCEKLLNSWKSTFDAGDISIVRDLSGRTNGVFKYVYDEICEDAELQTLIQQKNLDSITERLVNIISKHDGTIIPAPYEDIDDWWGDYNNTINYLVYDYTIERKSAEIVEQMGKESIRQEGPHKCSAIFSKKGPAEKISGFYTKNKKVIKLNVDQRKSLRWHQHYIELKDDGWGDSYPGWSFGVAVLTKVGDTGEKIVMDVVKQVEDKYGSFDCYTCEKWSFSLGQYVPEKNKKMISEIRKIIEQHNLNIVGAASL